MSRLITILIATVVAAGSVAAAADEQLMKQVQTIPLEGVEGRFDHFGVDVEAKRLYVAAPGQQHARSNRPCRGQAHQEHQRLEEAHGIRVLPGRGTWWLPAATMARFASTTRN